MAANWIKPAAGLAALFAAATLYAGGTALFGDAAAKAAVGQAVPFVLWFNFAMGFAYLAGAALLFFDHPAARGIALAIGFATALVFTVFLIAALRGTPFEMRTVGAMALRAGFWLGIGFSLNRRLR